MRKTTMHCRQWLDRLADYLDGCLAPEERGVFERHAAGCERCSALLDAVRNETPSPQGLAGFAESVLAHTSGPACGLVERAVAAREGGAGGDIHPLVQLHLANCARCRGLDAVLGWLIPLLRDMGETQPDKAFAADVLRVTRSPAPMPWRARVGEWWERVTSIPLIQWQAAYVGAAFLVVVGSSPLIPRQRAEALLTGVYAQVEARLHKVHTLPERLTSSVAPVWALTGARVVEPVESMMGEITRRYHGTADATNRVWSGFRVVTRAFREGEYAVASAGLRQLRVDARSLWKAVRDGEVSAPITGWDEGVQPRVPSADEFSSASVS